MQNYFNNLEESASAIHAGNTDKPSLPLSVALAIGSLYKALEAARGSRAKAYTGTFKQACLDVSFKTKIKPELIEFEDAYIHPLMLAKAFKEHIKDTVADELAAFVISCLDLAKGHGFNFADLQHYYALHYMDRVDNDYYKKIELPELVLTVTDEAIGVHALAYKDYKENSLGSALSMVTLYCQANDINLNWHIHYRLLYNSTRPLKHA